jgi:nitrite reductase (NADH) small subunit
MAFTRVASTNELQDNVGKCVTVGGKKIAIFKKGAECFAIDDSCTHMGASLSEGEVEGDNVLCPWHAALFSLRTGATAGPPARGGVKAYPCRVNGDGIEVDA